MQTKTHWQRAADGHLNARTGGARDAAESPNQSGPTMTNPQMDALLGGADDQSRQFARYAAWEAVQDGVFEQD